MLVLTVVLSWLFLLLVPTALIAYCIKKRIDNQYDMSKIYSAHGQLMMSMHATEPDIYLAPAGHSISSNGSVMTHYTVEDDVKITGYIVDFLSDTRIDGSHSLYMFSKTDPWREFPRDRHFGTIRYVVNRKGGKKYVDFTPDP